MSKRRQKSDRATVKNIPLYNEVPDSIRVQFSVIKRRRTGNRDFHSDTISESGIVEETKFRRAFSISLSLNRYSIRDARCRHSTSGGGGGGGDDDDEDDEDDD